MTMRVSKTQGSMETRVGKPRMVKSAPTIIAKTGKDIIAAANDEAKGGRI